MPQRKLCLGPCGKNRDVKFFGPNSRRPDGLSDKCNTCKRRRVQTTTRNLRLVKTYGISEADYQELFDAQGGACAICKGKRSYKLHVDHDHKLEALGLPPRETVRGLLCKSCNKRVLPAVRDDVVILLAAIRYLENPPARVLLAA